MESTQKPTSIKKHPSKQSIQSDRFIPLRTAPSNENENFQNLILNTSEPPKTDTNESISLSLLNSLMLDALCLQTSSNQSLSISMDQYSIDKNIIKQLKKKSLLNFSNITSTNNSIFPNQTPRTKNIIQQIKCITDSKLYENNNDNEIINFNEDNFRYICDTPEKILDAPNIKDDYYLNLIDWSKKNLLSVVLGHNVYLWNSETLETTELYYDNSYRNVTSLKWMDNGDIIALGFNDGNCGLYDVEKMTLIRMLTGHKENCRVGSLAWNNYILSTGSKDKMIYNHDVREKKHVFSSLKGHRNEVCQLQWSNDINCLASGGNDNLLCLWHLNGTSQLGDVDDSSCNNVIFPRVCFTQHKAAIRALAWCPYQRNVLVSGGGTKDKSIKMWNTATSTLISSYDTSSQVCNVMFNKYEKELISTHGYSKNQICIWSYPKMKKITELMGHMNRVLYMAMSPDGCTIVTGSADETLRFWTINEEDKVNDLLNKSLTDNSKSGKRSKYNDNKHKGLFSNINIR